MRSEQRIALWTAPNRIGFHLKTETESCFRIVMF
jgi:hypothetical protein